MKMFTVGVLLFAFGAAFASKTVAGEPVTGSGATKAAAADDANRRAAELAKTKGLTGTAGTCYTAAKIDECRKDADGGYVCTANTANHHGSCKQ